MKKILFFIILISPNIDAEILELTCEVPMPIHIVYDFEKEEGYTNMPNQSSDLLIRKGGKRAISKALIEGDYYVFQNKSIHTVWVNRITLKGMFYTKGGSFVTGSCEKGLKTYDKYQI